MSKIHAEAYSDKHGKYGYNICIEFKDDTTINFFGKEHLTLCRHLDELSQACLRQNVEMYDSFGKCCECRSGVTRPSNFGLIFALFVLSGMFYIAISYMLIDDFDQQQFRKWQDTQKGQNNGFLQSNGY